MKCYSVIAEIEILVVAESKDEARQIAQGGAIVDDLAGIADEDLSVRVASFRPYGWDRESIVYGGDGTMTVEQALALNKQE